MLLAARAKTLDDADQLLASYATSPATPTAIELLCGPAWQEDGIVGETLGRDKSTACALVVGLEGTEPEVKWMTDQVGREWRTAGVEHYVAVVDSDATGLWQRLTEFPQSGPAPLVLKGAVVPSHVTRLVAELREIDAKCSIQSHAGNGIVLARFSEFPPTGLSRTLMQKLVPLAAQGQGNVTVLSNPEGAEMTRVSVWGGLESPVALMGEVKKQFDPQNILNPGRFVYA
jgi:FAD/FMN-containing dehydrogenase